MSPVYQIADRKDSRALSQYLARDGQLLLPMVELMSSAQVAVEEFMDVLGRAVLKAVPELSAQQVAGPRRWCQLRGQTPGGSGSAPEVRPPLVAQDLEAVYMTWFHIARRSERCP